MPEGIHHESYDPAFFQPLFQIEDRHFWFQSRNRIIAVFLKRLTSDLKPGYRVLEVGCGTGNVLRLLNDICSDGTVVGLDLFAEGLKYAQQRTSAALVQADMHHPPFSNCFDIIGLFDVLEHLSDDRQVLRDLNGMTREGGFLFVTVPAHPQLWSYFDEASRHCRRYQPDELEYKLVEAGYRVEYISQYMMSIFPLVWAGRKLSSLRRRRFVCQGGTSSENLASQELHLLPIINDVLLWLLDIERRWLASGRVLPLGTSLLAIARKCR